MSKNNLTQRQKDIIFAEQLGKHRNLSLDLGLHADLVLLMQDNPDRFNGNFSAVIREACYCYLQMGLDWRSSNNGEIIAAIRQEFKQLKMVRDSGDAITTTDAANQKMDDKEGFFSE